MQDVWCRMWWHTPLVSALGRQISVLEANLECSESQTSRHYKMKLCWDRGRGIGRERRDGSATVVSGEWRRPEAERWTATYGWWDKHEA